MSETLSGPIFFGMIFLAAAMPQSAHAMSRDTAISAGSFFAATAQCESRNLISPGQADAVMKALNRYISKSDQAHMKSGYARGEQDSQVYVVQQKQWSDFKPSEESCYRVQGVVDGYKEQLGID